MDENELRKILEQVEKEMEEKGITDDQERETYMRCRLMPLNLHIAEIDTDDLGGKE